MAVVDITDLRYSYPAPIPGRDPVPVLKGVTLQVGGGEFLALMGRTGAGKTTLCMALNGLVPQATGGVIGGQVRVLGLDPRCTPVAEMAMHVGIVFQDVEAQLVCTTVEEEIAFGLENLGVDPRQMAERIRWALQLVRMEGFEKRAPQLLSGGQKQRVAIATALAMQPAVLVLDEPTSGLDPAGQHQVFEVIERLARERLTTIIMASQDAELVARHADRVAVLSEGIIARDDAPRRIFWDREFMSLAGLALPQIYEVAQTLNAQLGTAYRFHTLDHAESALVADLAKGQASA